MPLVTQPTSLLCRAGTSCSDTANFVTVQGCYQLFWLFLIVYGAPAHLPHYHVTTECETMSHLHTSEYGGLLAINLRNVTTTPPYRNLDLCCSGAECFTSGGVYYPGRCSRDGEEHCIRSTACTVCALLVVWHCLWCCRARAEPVHST